MTNEEFFNLLDELSDNLGDYSFNEIKDRIVKLRDYAKDNFTNDELINDTLD